jgi:two-component sensor histidine kinase
LAVVLNELMQNAVDHAFPLEDVDGRGVRSEGHVHVTLVRGEAELCVDVHDDGVGLPAGFSLEESRGLGLSIVHALVTSELGGSIEMSDDHGTRVRLRVPIRQATPVEL